jgi:hypothetical protein
MMSDDPNPFSMPPSPGPSPAPSPAPPTTAAAASVPAEPISAAVVKFQSCRWRAQPDEGPYCTHRDVLPLAGKEGFKPDAWCPDCAFFKVRRAPRKRTEY